MVQGSQGRQKRAPRNHVYAKASFNWGIWKLSSLTLSEIYPPQPPAPVDFRIRSYMHVCVY